MRLADGISVGSFNQIVNVGDTSEIMRLDSALADGRLHNVHSVLLYKDSVLVYEKYLCGKDERHGKKLGNVAHDVYTLHDMRSISKSVVAACIGIALQRGVLKSVYEPIGDFFGGLPKEKAKITIHDLLTMSSGLSWKEVGLYGHLLNDETKMNISFYPLSFILRKQQVHKPGTVWNYSAGNTQLLAAILKVRTGLDIDSFARKYLFAPLGIQQTEWIRLFWKSDPAAASGLRLTSRELLKLGVLFEQNGQYHNMQLIDKAWVDSCLTSHINRPDLSKLLLDNGGYGYQFWTYNYSRNNKWISIAEAKGNGGQSLFICRDLHFVLVVTAGNYGQSAYNDIPGKILKDYILPYVCQ
ncbi:serine hydrolase domain-containing protein [Chitinophaga dinghuensis]|nr:serine hydrolase [Chitinophaga dinghuensis]